jgi:hypothetical protein
MDGQELLEKVLKGPKKGTLLTSKEAVFLKKDAKQIRVDGKLHTLTIIPKGEQSLVVLKPIKKV